MSSTVLYLAIVAVWAVVLVPMWLRRDSESAGFSLLRQRRAAEDLPAGEDDAHPFRPDDSSSSEESSGEPRLPGRTTFSDEERADGRRGAGEPARDPRSSDTASTENGGSRSYGGGSSGSYPAGPREGDQRPATSRGARSSADGAPGRDPRPARRTEPAEGELDDERYESTRPRYSRGAVIARRRRRTFGLILLFLASAVAAAAGLGPWWITMPPVGLLGGHLSLLRVAAGIDSARREAMLARRAQLRAAERAAAAARAAAEAEEAAAQAEIIELADHTREVFDQYADDRRAVGD